MARPKTKEDLLQQSQTNYNKLLVLIEQSSIDVEQFEFPEKYLNRNIRDVLAHLHEWHIMMIGWYEIGMAGNKPEMPAKGHSWRTLPALNKEIQVKYNQTSYDDAKTLFKQSYLSIRQLIEQHTDEELFEKKRYNWTGSTSLGAYFISNTSSHYDWAIKLIKRAIRATQ